MVTQMAFANVLARAGLLIPSSISSDSTGTNATEGYFNVTAEQKNRTVSAISTNSGGSWFSTQFFYSDEFHRRVVHPDTTTLTHLVSDWMEEYAVMQEKIPTLEDPLLSRLDIDTTFLTSLLYYNGSMGNFILDMLQSTSTHVYNDSGFVNRSAGFDNRIEPLANVDLLIQMTLSPTALSQSADGPFKTLTYVSPSNASEEGPAFAVPLSFVHVITSNKTYYYYGVPPGSMPLMSLTSEAPSKFRLDDWQGYSLYMDEEDVQVATTFTTPLIPDNETAQPLNQAFDGQTPTVVQVAAASSNNLGSLSSSNPSMLAQFLSITQSSLNEWVEEPVIDLQGDTVYSLLSTLTMDVAVCSQWPLRPCGENDARLVDGGYIDNNALVANIAAYQASHDEDLNTTLKLFLTEADESFDQDPYSGDPLLLSYFSSAINQDIAPGEPLWPASSPDQYAAPNPVLSLQIFGEYMNSSELQSLRNPISGTNITTSILKGTTIDNPTYGVRAGQAVEIFYFEIHSSIPTTIVGVNQTRYWTPKLADLAWDISTVAADDLIVRIDEFLAS
jgi:hypothetical protein